MKRLLFDFVEDKRTYVDGLAMIRALLTKLRFYLVLFHKSRFLLIYLWPVLYREYCKINLKIVQYTNLVLYFRKLNFLSKTCLLYSSNCAYDSQDVPQINSSIYHSFSFPRIWTSRKDLSYSIKPKTQRTWNTSCTV